MGWFKVEVRTFHSEHIVTLPSALCFAPLSMKHTKVYISWPPQLSRLTHHTSAHSRMSHSQLMLLACGLGRSHAPVTCVMPGSCLLRGGDFCLSWKEAAQIHPDRHDSPMFSLWGLNMCWWRVAARSFLIHWRPCLFDQELSEVRLLQISEWRMSAWMASMWARAVRSVKTWSYGYLVTSLLNLKNLETASHVSAVVSVSAGMRSRQHQCWRCNFTTIMPLFMKLKSLPVWAPYPLSQESSGMLHLRCFPLSESPDQLVYPHAKLAPGSHSPALTPSV